MTICDLNDRFRRSFTGGRICMTHGVANLPDPIRMEALAAVREFDDFTEDNDPYDEHDFGRQFQLLEAWAEKVGG